MKETGWMITAVTASATAALALGLVAIVVLHENRGLRQELRSARQQCEQAAASARQSAAPLDPPAPGKPLPRHG